MRFYADVNFNGHVVRELRRRGIDFVTAREDGQGRTLDPDLLDRTTLLGRVLCTHDRDFLREGARRQKSGVEFAGVVHAPQEGVPIGKLVADLLLIAEATDEDYWRSRVELVPF